MKRSKEAFFLSLFVCSLQKNSLFLICSNTPTNLHPKYSRMTDRTQCLHSNPYTSRRWCYTHRTKSYKIKSQFFFKKFLKNRWKNVPSNLYKLHWQDREILRRSEQLLPIFFCRRVSTLALQKLGRRKKVAKTVKDERSDGWTENHDPGWKDNSSIEYP